MKNGDKGRNTSIRNVSFSKDANSSFVAPGGKKERIMSRNINSKDMSEEDKAKIKQRVKDRLSVRKSANFR